MTNEEALDLLAGTIEDLDNSCAAMKLAMPAEFHLELLKELIPEKVKALKSAYVVLAKENPWKY